MFSPKSIAILTLAANAVLGVPTWRRNNYPSPGEWKSKNLESYYKFKIRYRHIGCVQVEGTDFYNQCCVPLPKGQVVPEQCMPSACLAHTPAPTTPASAPAPTPTETLASTVSQDGSDYSGDYGNDDEEDCEDDSHASGEGTGDDDNNLPYCDEVSGEYEPEPVQPTTPAPAPEPSLYTTTELEPTPAPEPEPTTAPEPEPTTTTEPEPTTTTEPEPTTTAPDNNNGGNNSGNGEVQTGGYATWYVQDSNEAACGGVYTDDQMIGAIDERRYGDSSQHSSECGRRVRITNDKNGKSVEITLVDDCPTCENANSIDLSLSAFDQIAERVEGMVPISWVYL